MESTEAVEHSEELERRGMKPEVKDVEFVLGADTEDTDGDEDDGISMIVINNVPVAVFSCNQAKAAFETMLRAHGRATFSYVKSLKRAHASYHSEANATAAVEALDEMIFQGEELHIFSHQKHQSMDSKLLAPPKPKKLMLISPPCSPPDGWEPIPENSPILNYDLVAALASLSDSREDIEIQPETASSPRLVLQSSGLCL